MSAFYYYLNYEARPLAKLDFNSVHGIGRVNPRLSFIFGCMTLNPDISAQLLSLQLDVMSGNELLATGSLKAAGRALNLLGDTIQVETVLLPNTIAFLEETARDNDLSIGLQFHGQLRVSGDLSGVVQPNAAAEGQILPVASSNGTLNIPHSDWLKNILEPIGVGRYMSLTLRFPTTGADP